MNRRTELIKKRIRLETIIEKADRYMLLMLLLAIIGGMMNLIAVFHNNMIMPVYTNESINSTTHIAFNVPEDVNKFIYTDWIKVDRGVYMSVGDILIFYGIINTFTIVFLSIYYTFVLSRVKKKLEADV